MMFYDQRKSHWTWLSMSWNNLLMSSDMCIHHKFMKMKSQCALGFFLVQLYLYIWSLTPELISQWQLACNPEVIFLALDWFNSSFNRECDRAFICIIIHEWFHQQYCLWCTNEFKVALWSHMTSQILVNISSVNGVSLDPCHVFTQTKGTWYCQLVPFEQTLVKFE